MGTLSKRGLREFGIDVEQRIQQFRSNVGRKIDDLAAHADPQHPEGIWSQRLHRVAGVLSPATWFALAGVSALGTVAFAVARRHLTASVAAASVPTFVVLGLHNRFRLVARGRIDDRVDVH